MTTFKAAMNFRWCLKDTVITKPLLSWVSEKIKLPP